jgi:omega-hydroxy-beta-dihydromenaquinone-9 sulfotransferase
MYSDFDTMRTMLRLAHDPANFSARRALFTDALVSLATTLGTFNRACERVDDLLYPGHAHVDVGKPIYIVAAPRSGTTFLHRMMSLDPQFTTFKLYQTFVPTVTGHKLADGIASANGGLGALLGRLRRGLDESSFGAWEGIHDTGLAQDEEDEALWALAYATPAIWLVLPFPDQLDHVRFTDRLPRAKRDALVAYYRSCVQRHLYTTPGKTLLGKNVLLPSRFEIVTEAVPSARFVHILRHPYEAIPSTLSLFTIPWRWHSPEVPLDGPAAKAMAQLMMDYYRFLHRESQRSEAAGDKRFYCVPYRKLLADPAQRVFEIYERFGLTLTDEVRERLLASAAEQRRWKSEHTYSLAQFGLSKEYVYEQLKDVFDYYDFER